MVGEEGEEVAVPADDDDVDVVGVESAPLRTPRRQSDSTTEMTVSATSWY